MRKLVRPPGEQEQNRGAGGHEMGDGQADRALGLMGGSKGEAMGSPSRCAGPLERARDGERGSRLGRAYESDAGEGSANLFNERPKGSLEQTLGNH